MLSEKAKEEIKKASKEVAEKAAENPWSNNSVNKRSDGRIEWAGSTDDRVKATVEWNATWFGSLPIVESKSIRAKKGLLSLDPSKARIDEKLGRSYYDIERPIVYESEEPLEVGDPTFLEATQTDGLGELPGDRAQRGNCAACGEEVFALDEEYIERNSEVYCSVDCLNEAILHE